MLITVRGHTGPVHLMNVYSDENGSAIRYLEDHLDAFPDVSYMGGDFNCPSAHWDATLNHEHPMANRLMECAAALSLERIAPPSGRVTHLPYNSALRGSILDLVFVPAFRGYTADLTLGEKGEPDHFPLLLDIPLRVEFPEGKMSIKVDSEEEDDFLAEVRLLLGLIPIPDVMSAEQTQLVAQAVAEGFETAWSHHAKANRACARSKSWWDNDCARTRSDAMESDNPEHWKAFKAATRKAKRKHFDERIDEIAHTNLRPWDLQPPESPQ